MRRVDDIGSPPSVDALECVGRVDRESLENRV